MAWADTGVKYTLKPGFGEAGWEFVVVGDDLEAIADKIKEVIQYQNTPQTSNNFAQPAWDVQYLKASYNPYTQHPEDIDPPEITSEPVLTIVPWERFDPVTQQNVPTKKATIKLPDPLPDPVVLTITIKFAKIVDGAEQ